MSREYPESPGECYVDLDAQMGPGGDLALLPDHLLDADTAANFIANLISDFTGEEVDGDGDPWGIACDHLHGLLANLTEALTARTTTAESVRLFINNEYGYSIGRGA